MTPTPKHQAEAERLATRIARNYDPCASQCEKEMLALDITTSLNLPQLLANADRVKELETEIKACLDLEPSAIRDCEGGGLENICGSLALTMAKVRHEKDQLRAELETVKVHLADANKGARINAMVNQRLTAKLALAEKCLSAEHCPNCPNRGWYEVFVQGEPAQEQCEWCYRMPNSLFNAKTAYDNFNQQEKK